MKHLIEHHVFVYGTLRNPKLLKRVIGHDVPNKIEKIRGEREDIDTYPNIKPEKDKRHVITGHEITVDDADLKKLDKWEERYKRKKVRLSDHDTAYYYRLKKEYDQAK